MKRKRYTETQVLKESEAGRRTGDIVGEYGSSEKTLYNWSKYGGLEAGDLSSRTSKKRIADSNRSSLT